MDYKSPSLPAIYYPKDALHGTHMKFNELTKLFPDRNKFLNKDLYDRTTKRINKGQSLRFMPSSIIEKTVREEGGQPSSNQYAKGWYKIIISGVLSDGRTAIVMIENIYPYFLVKIPESSNFSAMKYEITKLCEKNTIKYEGKLEKIHGKEFKYNSEADYIKLSFRTLNYRNKALWLMKDYETVHNDSRLSTNSTYYNVVGRDYSKSFASWAVIKNYNYTHYNPEFNMKIFKVDINDYTLFVGNLDYESSRDKSIELDWDIETFSLYPIGEVPQPEISTDIMFMIGISIQYYDTSINTNKTGERINGNLEGELLNVVLVDNKTKPHPNKLTIVCGNEKNIIKAFAIIFGKIRPEFVCGFNDCLYDWHWLAWRAHKHKIIRFLEKRMSLIEVADPKNKNLARITDYKYYAKITIKITADLTIEQRALSYFGYIIIDVRTQFRRLYPTDSQSSLKYYLAKCKLGSKVDMPYTTLFNIYRFSWKIQRLEYAKIFAPLITPTLALHIVNKFLGHEEFFGIEDCTCKELKDWDYLTKKSMSDMADASEYCYVDALRCHELLIRRGVVKTKRNFAELTNTSLLAGMIKADGGKIRNLLIARGQKRGMWFDSNKHSYGNESFPGAYVGFPDKGLIACKLSIDERVAIANQKIIKTGDEPIDESLYENELDNRRKHILWKYVTDEEIAQMHQFINKYSACITNIDDIYSWITPLIEQFDKIYCSEFKQPSIADRKSVKLSISDEDLHELQKLSENIQKNYNITCKSPVSVCLVQFITEINKYPVTSFDFQSLYPNIIITYNLSPEYLITERKTALEARSQGLPIQRVAFTDKGQKYRGWFVRHGGDDNKMGLFPSVLKDIQRQRNIQKLPKLAYEHMLERMAQTPSITLSELINHTYTNVNKKSKRHISKKEIIEKHLHLNMADILRNGRV